MSELDRKSDRTTPEPTLTVRTVHGLKWTYASTAVGVLLQLGYTAVMSRLLLPAEFGLVAMAGLFLRFGSHFAEMGIGSAIVQKRQLTDRDVDAAFGSCVVLGTFFALVVSAAAPAASLIFHQDGVVPVVRTMGAALAIDAIGIPSLAILRRQMRFRALAFIEVTSYVVGYLAVGITMAAFGFGVWSLVGAALSQLLAQSSLALLAVRHPIKISFRLAELKVLYSFGARVSLISFFEFVGFNLDTLAVGRYAGAAPLGQYSRASNLVAVPFEKATKSLSKVLFPAFSQVQDEHARVRSAYLTSLRMASAFLIPAALAVAVTAEHLIDVLFGPRWRGAAVVLPILCVANLVNYLTHFGSLLCEALARLNQKLVILTVTNVGLMILLWLSRGRTLRAYAGAITLAFIVQHVAYQGVLSRFLRLSLRDFVGVYTPGIVAGVGVSLLAGLIGYTSERLGLGSPAVLAAQVSFIACAMSFSFSHGPLRGIRRELRSRLLPALTGSSPASGTTALIDRILRVGG